MSVRTRELSVLGLHSRVLKAGPDTGDEAVVLVHGGPGSADDWSHLLPRIGAFARAVAFDLPGFGEADKPGDWWGYSSAGWANFIAGALDELGIGRVHLVATDLGGEAGTTWAAAHPDALASAVLLNTGVPIGYRWHAVGRLHRIPLLGQVPAWAGRIGFRTVMRLYEPKLPREVIDRWWRGYDWGTRRAMLRFYRANPATSVGRLAPVLRRLDRPALVVWGGRNRFVPVEQAERQRESFPSAEVVVFEDSGHYLHLGEPDRTAETVIPFLRRQLGAE